MSSSLTVVRSVSVLQMVTAVDVASTVSAVAWTAVSGATRADAVERDVADMSAATGVGSAGCTMLPHELGEIRSWHGRILLALCAAARVVGSAACSSDREGRDAARSSNNADVTSGATIARLVEESSARCCAEAECDT